MPCWHSRRSPTPGARPAPTGSPATAGWSSPRRWSVPRPRPARPVRSAAGTAPWPAASADASTITCASPPTRGFRSTTRPSATSRGVRAGLLRCPTGPTTRGVLTP